MMHGQKNIRLNNKLIALTLKWPVRDSPWVKEQKKKERKNERTN